MYMYLAQDGMRNEVYFTVLVPVVLWEKAKTSLAQLLLSLSELNLPKLLVVTTDGRAIQQETCADDHAASKSDKLDTQKVFLKEDFIGFELSNFNFLGS